MKAHELLAPEGAWTQGTTARDAAGKPTHPLNGDAVSFCTLGAIGRCYGGYNYETSAALFKLQCRIEELGYHTPIAPWNDAINRTQAQVVALLKELDI
jgi:hypothetical protein